MYNLRATHERKISVVHIETAERMAQALESFNFLLYLLHSKYKGDELTDTNWACSCMGKSKISQLSSLNSIWSHESIFSLFYFSKNAKLTKPVK